MLLSFLAHSQVPDFDTAISKIEAKLSMHSYRDAIWELDVILREPSYTSQNRAICKALKVEGLSELDLLDESLVLSNEVIKLDELPSKYLIRVRFLRAEMYALINREERAHVELDSVAKYYDLHPKDSLYGYYSLTRGSVFQKNNVADAAKAYALDAKKYALKNHEAMLAADASFLQGLATPIKYKELKHQYFQEALKLYKRIKDNRRISETLFTIAVLKINKKEYNAAQKYLDSARIFLPSEYDAALIPDIYLNKSETFEAMGKTDSALQNLKLYKRSNEVFVETKRRIALEQAQVSHLMQQEAFEQSQAIESIQRLENEQKESRYFFIGLIAVIAIITLLLLRLFTKNKKINSQKMEIENKNVGLNTSVSEKQILLKELNHRVKNNLALIISLIKFHSISIDELFYKEKFDHLEKRINAIAMAHEQFIYVDTNDKGNLYDLKEYLQKIANALILMSHRKIDYHQEIENNEVNIDTALPIGILLNELISNSVKHAIVKEKTLSISVFIKIAEDRLELTYEDSGHRFNEEIKPKSLGLFIIESMVKQLKGSYQRVGSKYAIRLFVK